MATGGALVASWSLALVACAVVLLSARIRHSRLSWVLGEQVPGREELEALPTLHSHAGALTGEFERARSERRGIALLALEPFVRESLSHDADATALVRARVRVARVAAWLRPRVKEFDHVVRDADRVIVLLFEADELAALSAAQRVRSSLVDADLEVEARLVVVSEDDASFDAALARLDAEKSLLHPAS